MSDIPDGHGHETSHGFMERHRGERLPPIGTKRGPAHKPCDDLIPLSIHGMVIPITIKESWGVIGQIVSCIQTRESIRHSEEEYGDKG